MKSFLLILSLLYFIVDVSFFLYLSFVCANSIEMCSLLMLEKENQRSFVCYHSEMTSSPPDLLTGDSVNMLDALWHLTNDCYLLSFFI